VVGERRPEESEQIEVGVRKRLLGDRLGLTLAVYEVTRDNIAIPDPNGFTQQAGDQRSRGIELELSGRLPAEVDALFSYAYNESELTRFAELVQTGSQPPFVVLDRSGNEAPLAPEHLANLWLHRRIGTVDVGLGARWVGSQFLSAANEAEIEGYGLLDASLVYTVSSWRFSVFLENLTDSEYETRGFGSFSVIPGAPFAARAGVEYRF
jgi:outer membrane receptor protein involved in Fe transport